MHRFHAALEAAAGVPAIHIADATGAALQQAGCRHPALLGTRFTMEGDFYRKRLRDRYGMEPVIPDEPGRALIHDIIHSELCLGIIKPDSKRKLLARIEQMRVQGADGVILGCTELPMLIAQSETDLPVLDATAIHAESGVAFITAPDPATA